MEKSLRWKKTIGILAIILSGLRFISGISAYAKIENLKQEINYSSSYISNTYIEDVRNYISHCETILPLQLIVLCAILVLGISLLCTEKGIPDTEPRPISHKITVSILIGSLIHFSLEIITYNTIPASIKESISTFTIIGSLGFVLVLIGFCIAGLVKREWNGEKPDDFIMMGPITQTHKKTLSEESDKTELTQLDREIAELKKQIEKRKLEKEFAQLEAEKQTTIEKLKKELEELN